MLITLEQNGVFHHSAGNEQFAFHTLFLTPGTDQSMFITGRAHYSQLILPLYLILHVHAVPVRRVLLVSLLYKNCMPSENNMVYYSCYIDYMRRSRKLCQKVSNLFSNFQGFFFCFVSLLGEKRIQIPLYAGPSSAHQRNAI